MCDLFTQTFEVTIALGLHSFLQHVEMQNQPIGTDHLDGPAAMIDGIAVIELHSAEIREQQNIRGDIPNLEGIGNRWLFDGNPLGANTHGDTQTLSRRCEIAIHLACESKSAGHRGDKDWRLKLRPEKLRADVDLVNIELRQGIMDETIAIQPGAEKAGNACGIKAEFEMFLFT